MKTLVFFLSLCCAAFAQNQYYVSTSGSDSNNGSSSGTAWKTIPHAISSFTLGAAGAVIHVAAGTYTTLDHCVNFNNNGAALCVIRGGSSASVRLVVQCDPGIGSATAAQGKCMLRPTGTPDAGVVVENASNIDVVGFDIGSCGSCSSGVKNLNGNSVHVIGNYIHDLGGNACFGDGGIEMSNTHGANLSDQKVLRNFITRYGPDRSTSCNLMHGIYVNTPNGTIENNLVVGAPTYGIQYYSSGCKGVISNNVVIHVKGGFVVGNDGSATACSPQGSNTINNNYFADVVGKSVLNYSAGASQCDGTHQNFFGHNMSDGSAANFNAGPFSCDIVSPTSLVHQSGPSFFVNYQTNGSGNYHLSSGSLGIGTGIAQCSTGTGAITLCTPSADFEGTAISTAIDVGAYKASGGTVIQKPAPPTGLTAIVH